MFEDRIKELNARGFFMNLLQLTPDCWCCTVREGTGGYPYRSVQGETAVEALDKAILMLDEKKAEKEAEIDLDDLL
jgi:hypothetical protein